MSEEMVLIQYIGKQRPYKDNVRPASGRLWPKPGHALRLPAREKFSYLAHPGSFKQTTDEEYASYQVLVAEESIRPFIDQLSGQPVENLIKIRDACDKAIAAGKKTVKKTSVEKVVVPPENSKDVSNSDDPGTASAYAARVNRITSAIKEMDLKNDWQGKDGWPIPKAVQERCGLLPSYDELVDAMALLGIDAVPPPEDQVDPQLAERAQIALGEVQDADLDTLKEMADTFGVEYPVRANTDTLRKYVTDALKDLAFAKANQTR